MVVDLQDASVINLTTDDLVDDGNYALTQEIALAVLERGAEGLLVPAASLMGHNLVVLFDNLQPGSRIEVSRYLDPRLLMDRL